jgi:acyl-CoA thioesterase-1
LRLRPALRLVVLICTGLAIQPSLAASLCPEVPRPRLTLPAMSEALRRGEPLVIVAVGSSSTRGAAASDAAHTYPAILQVELQRRLPMTHVAVINRGLDGQDAVEELARFDSDVAAVRPQLVIWQVGANAALRDADPAVFRATVGAGVRWLHQPGRDVILMDNQRSPRVLATPHRRDIEQALAQAAEAGKVPFFSRGQLMDRWQVAGYPYQQFISPDGLHHNDLGYRCLAEAIALSVMEAMRAPGAP